MDDLDLGATIKGFSPGQKILNRYTLARILGRGGMGVVWLARDEELGREVALKFLPEVVAADRVAVEEMKREVRRAINLAHPHIIKTNDFLTDGRTTAVSMEYAPGGTVSAARLDQPGEVFSPGQLAPWVEQLCAALDYAHTDAEVVHRDLKPSNLMLDGRQRLKVVDFGIAASISESVSRVSKQAGSSGTPVYMSPQQMMGEEPAPSDDIYAVGATLFELLTGKPPFHAGNIMLQVQNKPAPLLNERRKALGLGPVPAEWEQTIAACLAKDPAARPASAAALSRMLRGEPVAGGMAPAASLLPVKSSASPPPAPAALPAAVGPEISGLRRWLLAPLAGASLPTLILYLSVAQNDSNKGAFDPGSMVIGLVVYAAASLFGLLVMAGLVAAKPKGYREFILCGAVGGCVLGAILAAAQDAPVGWIASSLFSYGLAGAMAAYWIYLIGLGRPAAARPLPSWLKPAQGLLVVILLIFYGYLLPDTVNGNVRARQAANEHERLQQFRRDAAPAELKAQPSAKEAKPAAVVPPEETAPAHPMPDRPWENSLGMVFKPVPGTTVLFSIWETRVRDFRAFLLDKGRELKRPDFPQGPTHPVAFVSWYDAKAFCEWLTEHERRAGLLGASQRYRLPTDAEWSAALGLTGEPEGAPSNRDGDNVRPYYPWGNEFPIPKGFGNYPAMYEVDDYEYTSPVGTFPANQFGLHDLGGNVWEWCEDLLYDPKSQLQNESRTMRGAAFYSEGNNFGSGTRMGFTPEQEGSGFRAVLETGAARPATKAYPGPFHRRDEDFIQANLRASEKFLAELDKDAGIRRLPSGLRRRAPHPGTGAAVNSHSTVELHYAIKDTAGKLLDSTERRGGNLQTAVKNLVPGLAERLRYVRAGGRIELIIPSAIGYGESGEGVIPPGATLLVELELLKVDGEAAPPAGRAYAPELRATTRLEAGQPWPIVDLGLQLLSVPSGQFAMGNAQAKRDEEKPVTQVQLGAFWLGRTEVTQAQWRAVMGGLPANIRAGDFLPINLITRDEAMEFCRRLTARERQAGRLPAGYEFTLPTEAQWEYAARAGSVAMAPDNPEEETWHDKNSNEEVRPAGQKRPNAWGFHDMSGNVSEWCRAWMGVYPGGTLRDPVGETERTKDAFRGGSAMTGKESADFVSRVGAVPDFKADSVGFRLALVPAPQ